MNGEKILTREPILIFLDSNSFSQEISNENTKAKTIIKYFQLGEEKKIDMIRSPLETDNKDLLKIPCYELICKKENDTIIKITRYRDLRDKKGSETLIGCYVNKYEVECVSEDIFGKKVDLDSETFNAIFNTLIFKNMLSGEKKGFYITNNKDILNNKYKFNSKWDFEYLNILSIDEAFLFLDLYIKYNHEYEISPYNNVNKGHWYLLSARTKLPHYNVGKKYIDAMFNKFKYLLMAIDEIGMQYYLGKGNDSMDNSMYHFNYAVSLITGIFDNLALETNDQLNINMSPDVKISLNKKSGKDFLKKVKDENSQIRNHITNFVNLTNTIYSFRELVIHKEGLPKMRFETNELGFKIKANLIKINQDIKDTIDRLGDSPIDNSIFTKFGLYISHDDYFLEPYKFIKEIVLILIEFTDKYLELLNFPNFIKKIKTKKDSFTDMLIRFESGRLGY